MSLKYKAVSNTYTCPLLLLLLIVLLPLLLLWLLQDHLYDLERELDMVDCFKFVLYPTTKRDEGKNSITTWSVRCIPEERDKFKSRLPLKKEWRGMRDLELGQAVLQQQQQQQKAVAAASSSTINNNESSGGGDAGLTPDDFVFCHATGFLGIAKTRVNRK